MAAYIVLEKPGNDRTDDVVFVRDGFRWLAFLVPTVWLLWHRLWIEAAVALAVTVLLSALGEQAGLGVYASVLTVLLSIYFGIEGATLRVRALARRGWQEWGVLEAPRLDDAEVLYATSEGLPESSSVWQSEPTPDWKAASPAKSDMIGLVGYPDRP